MSRPRHPIYMLAVPLLLGGLLLACGEGPGPDLDLDDADRPEIDRTDRTDPGDSGADGGPDARPDGPGPDEPADRPEPDPDEGSDGPADVATADVATADDATADGVPTDSGPDADATGDEGPSSDGGDGDGGGAPAPRVVLTKPPDGRVGVGTGAHVVFTFDRRMAASSLTGQADDGACTGTVQVSADGFTTCVGGTLDTSSNPIIYFTPSAPLVALTWYSGRVAPPAASEAGVELATPFAYRTGFRTGARAGSCRILYTTLEKFQGSAGGVDGADSLCTSDLARPSSVSFAQALLVDRTHRIACTTPDCSGSLQLEWVLAPRACYVRTDGDLLFDTNAYGIVTGTLVGPLSVIAEPFWSGLNADWTTASATTCDDWSTGGSGSGAVGSTGAVDRAWISDGTASCDSQLAVACAEQ